MKIDNEDIKLKITPKALLKVEENYKDFDILKLVREAFDTQKAIEPRLYDYYKVCYAGYLGATDKYINYEEFIEKIKNINPLMVNSTGVALLEEMMGITTKN